MSEAERVIDFWLGDSPRGPAAAEAMRERWYRGGEALDATILERFGTLVRDALAGRLSGWERSPEGALALVILLDQFTRHIYRGTPQAFAGDPSAMAMADRAIAEGLDQTLSIPGRVFLYHPYHHAETLAGQDRSVHLLEAMQRTAPPEWHDYIGARIEGFGRHRDIVARFGRFPHRNEILGRSSTPAEIAFMQAGAESFGQQVAR